MNDLRDDIEKYLAGKLSPSEMHALEKRALSDPFLAEALEGAQSMRGDDFSADMHQLREALQKKTRPSIGLWGWTARIAAGVALLVAATFLVINLTDNDKSKLAHTPVQTEKDSSTLAPPATQASPDSLITDAQQAKEDTPIRKSTPGIRRSAESAKATEPIAEAQQEESDDQVVEKEVLAADEVPSASGASVAKVDEGQNLSPKKVIRGNVVDADDGKGLPGVNVTIKGTNFGTITNAEGSYEIAMDSLKSGLLFSYIGYSNAEVVPGSANDNVNVALKTDVSQLSEVVVVGHTPTYDLGVPESITNVEMAAPEGGRKAYKQYLETHLKYPDEAINHKVEGKVTVQFTIEPTGKLSDFQILKGIGYGCDEEVVRLIQEGPKWNPTRKNRESVRDRVRVRMRFSLPKNK